MKKNSTKNRIVSQEVRRELSRLILEEVKDPRIAQLTTVTDVYVAPDLKTAKVYVSVLEDDKAEDMIKALKKAAGYIRHELGLRVDLRYTPELLFERDRNIAYGAHIAQVLRDVIPQETEAQGEENGDGKTE